MLKVFLGFGEGHILYFPLEFPTDRKTALQYHKWIPQTESSAGEISKDLVPDL